MQMDPLFVGCKGAVPFWKSLMSNTANEWFKKPASVWSGLTLNLYTRRGMKFDENAIMTACKKFTLKNKINSHL